MFLSACSFSRLYICVTCRLLCLISDISHWGLWPQIQNMLPACFDVQWEEMIFFWQASHSRYLVFLHEDKNTASLTNFMLMFIFIFYIWLSSVPRTLLLKDIWLTVTLTVLFLRNFLPLAKQRVRGGTLTIRVKPEDFLMISVVARFIES
jgi:hypothetical protein